MRRLSLPPYPGPRLSLAAACALLIAVAGCGEEGVAENATVTVYVSAPLCAEARKELARSRERAGDVRIRASCLEAAGSRGRLDLAAIGANARRATEDSSTVAYIGEPNRAVTRFSETILDSADIAQLAGISGSAAMSRVLRAIERSSGSSSLRESLHDELG